MIEQNLEILFFKVSKVTYLKLFFFLSLFPFSLLLKFYLHVVFKMDGIKCAFSLLLEKQVSELGVGKKISVHVRNGQMKAHVGLCPL